MTGILGGTQLPAMEEIGDNYPGLLSAFGKHFIGYSYDNVLDAGLIILTHENTSYTRPPFYHFLSEARYNGSEIFQLSPDYNATSPLATTHVPVKVGTDAAFWLGVCHELEKNNLYDADFIKEQTDLALLVNLETRRFLRGAEVDGSRSDQFFFLDEDSSRIAKAPRGTLKLDGNPALTGTHTATLENGEQVRVAPAFEILRRHLEGYPPATAARIAGVDPALITEMAEKMARNVTCVHYGLSSGKHYHGDLMERSLLLALAMTGNWGKRGSGIVCYTFTSAAINTLAALEQPAPAGLAGMEQFQEQIRQQLRAADPETNEETVQIELAKLAARMKRLTNATLFLYHHAGYKDLWNHQSWQDPAMSASFSDMVEEAVERGWLVPDRLTASGRDPQILLLVSHNPLRRIKQGRTQYPNVLFPKCTMVWTIETRLSSSAMYADILLPAAWYYEKYDMTNGGVDNPRRALIEPANPPVGEARPEWDIMADLMQKIGERARTRGLTEFQGPLGKTIPYAELWNAFTMGGAVPTQEDALKQLIAIDSLTGLLPRGYTLEKFQEVGAVEIEGLGTPFHDEMNASPYHPGEPFYSLRDHVEHHKIYPTYTRRAQFYIDHEWYLELGEALPVHKDTPKIGGEYPFKITGGHPRHSIHSIHQTSEHFAELHRGQPVVHVNPRAAEERGVRDGDSVKLFNDLGDCEVMAKVTPTCAPDQVIVYLWDAMLFRDWKNIDDLLVGLPKALQCAGGYEQIGRYYHGYGLPACTHHRGVRVDFQKA
jgi:DMSO reductase family type II enzyme molybdopterin subunit